MVKYDNILVTGANGLVGSAIEARGTVYPNVIGVGRDYDLLHWVEVDMMMRKHRPDAIIHLAAKVGGVQANMEAPATFFMENVTMNTHILEAARIYSVKRVICFLSTCVFPDPCPLPLEPKSLHLGGPHPSNYGYAFAKRMLAVQCQAYNEEYGTHFLPVIPCNIYGPHDNFNLRSSHVVPALIRKFWDAKQNNQPVTLWGSGRPRREFIYSGDVARLLLDLLDTYTSDEPIILSTGVEHSIRELAEVIAEVIGFKGDIIHDTSKPDGQFSKPSNNGPLRELFPKFEATPLRDGLTKTVKWFAENYPQGKVRL
jgi:GDP-L-fucose synthase